MTLPGKTLTDLAGMDSALRRAAEDAHRLTSGTAEQMRAIKDARIRAAAAAQLAPAIDLAAQLAPYHDLARIAQGPIADVADVLSHVSEFRGETLKRALAAMDEHNAHFRTLSDHLKDSAMFHEHISAVSKAFSISEPSIVQAMKNMQSPWLDMRNQSTSFRAFAELQGLSNVVTTLPAFDAQTGDMLRGALGDWRDPITLPQDIVDDIAARSDFYVGRGFDPTLTAFPRPAFHEALATGGLEEGAVADDDDDPPTAERNVDEEIRFRATSEAHNSLMRLEVRLRRFIDNFMSGEFGSSWPKHQMPNGLYDRWVEKKKRAEAGEATWPLVAYADFTDYERVICQKDNWSRVFHRFFRRRESVRESFQRLYPVRLAVMHARPITQDDELLLRAEVIRLTRSMKERA